MPATAQSNTPRPGTFRPATTGHIDRQITYRATPELQRTVRNALRRVISVQRTLESTYFDADGLPLYRCGAMLRHRGRSGREKRTVEAKVMTHDGLLRLKDDAALAATDHLVAHRPMRPVAMQTKHRQLLLVPGHRNRLAPDFVVALDHATVLGAASMDEHERCEIELQLFTALPWTSRVDDDRVERFHEFCRTCESEFGLVPSAHNGYQAIPRELLA